MALDEELIALMLEEVVIQPRTGIDKFNNISYGDPLEDGRASAGHVKCKIVRANKAVRNVQGRETISTVQVIFAEPTLEITTDSLLTLPDGTTPAIIEMDGAYDDVGPYWLEARA